MPSLSDHAGGDEALHRLEDTFYSMVLADPLVQLLFGKGKPDHVEHLIWFTAASDTEMRPLRLVPHWTWAGDDSPASAGDRP